jgi:hypothetical protein
MQHAVCRCVALRGRCGRRGRRGYRRSFNTPHHTIRTDARAGAHANVNAIAYADIVTHADAIAYADIVTYADAIAYADIVTYADAIAYADSLSIAIANAVAVTNAYAKAHTDPDAHAFTDADVSADRQPNLRSREPGRASARRSGCAQSRRSPCTANRAASRTDANVYAGRDAARTGEAPCSAPGQGNRLARGSRVQGRGRNFASIPSSTKQWLNKLSSAYLAQKKALSIWIHAGERQRAAKASCQSSLVKRPACLAEGRLGCFIGKAGGDHRQTFLLLRKWSNSLNENLELVQVFLGQPGSGRSPRRLQ